MVTIRQFKMNQSSALNNISGVNVLLNKKQKKN